MRLGANSCYYNNTRQLKQQTKPLLMRFNVASWQSIAAIASHVTPPRFAPVLRALAACSERSNVASQFANFLSLTRDRYLGYRPLLYPRWHVDWNEKMQARKFDIVIVGAGPQAMALLSQLASMHSK